MKKNVVFFCISLFAALSASAFQSKCPYHYPNGENSFDILDLYEEICYSEFSVIISKKDRRPVYTSYYSNSIKMQGALSIRRSGSFRNDYGRARTIYNYSFYSGLKGYDRGHLVPAGDMPDLPSQLESFNFENTIPQLSSTNRGKWADLEADIRRRLTDDANGAYILTGPTSKINSTTQIPNGIYKLVVWKDGSCDLYHASNKYAYSENQEIPRLSPHSLKNIVGPELYSLLSNSSQISCISTD